MAGVRGVVVREMAAGRGVAALLGGVLGSVVALLNDGATCGITEPKYPSICNEAFVPVGGPFGPPLNELHGRSNAPKESSWSSSRLMSGAITEHSAAYRCIVLTRSSSSARYPTISASNVDAACFERSRLAWYFTISLAN
jgi:hypothetical protein